MRPALADADQVRTVSGYLRVIDLTIIDVRKALAGSEEALALDAIVRRLRFMGEALDGVVRRIEDRDFDAVLAERAEMRAMETLAAA